MAVAMDLLIKIFDEAVTNGMASAIAKYGSSLTPQQIADLQSMSPQQIADTLKDLLRAQGNLAKPEWFDTNNNNNK